MRIIGKKGEKTWVEKKSGIDGGRGLCWFECFWSFRIGRVDIL